MFAIVFAGIPTIFPQPVGDGTPVAFSVIWIASMFAVGMAFLASCYFGLKALWHAVRHKGWYFEHQPAEQDGWLHIKLNAPNEAMNAENESRKNNAEF